MGSDFSELKKLTADLGRAGPRTAKRASQVVRKTATDIVREAKKRAPRDPTRPPQDPERPVTGNLKGSIESTMMTKLSAEVGPSAEYGIFQEMGTSTMPARPFMGPATDRFAPLFEQAMEQVVSEALND